jgi:hypothetical protein
VLYQLSHPIILIFYKATLQTTWQAATWYRQLCASRFLYRLRLPAWAYMVHRRFQKFQSLQVLHPLVWVCDPSLALQKQKLFTKTSRHNYKSAPTSEVINAIFLNDI